MFDIPGPLGTFFNFLVIALGFGFIVFVHELGHFIAAKWAGIRVLAFSIGFGQVACSYRKGMGFRAGSSEPEYMKLVRENDGDHTKLDISPTEYRLSWLPLGGYVKMLGQEDLNPVAVSSAPDSYQNCPIPKRLVVISAGVIVNVITAALLFILVFSVGLRIMPPTIGQVLPSSPAALATPVDDQYTIGLQPGDRVLSINNKEIVAFRDIATEAAMSKASKPASIMIQREGIDQPIEYLADLKPGADLGLLDLGVTPLRSSTLGETGDPELWSRISDEFSIDGVPEGATITHIGGQSVSTFHEIEGFLSKASSQESMRVDFLSKQGAGHFEIRPELAYMTNEIEVDDGLILDLEHVFGLTGLMQVDPDAKLSSIKQGLMPGDIFIEIGALDYPTIPEGIKEIRKYSGKPLNIRVLRGFGDSNQFKLIDLLVQVNDNGRIGFIQKPTLGHSTIIAQVDGPFGVIPPGSVIKSVDNVAISKINEIPLIVVQSTNRTADGVTVEVTYSSFDPADMKEKIATVHLSNEQVKELSLLSYQWPGGNEFRYAFNPVQHIDKAGSPVAAVKRGIHESRRVMLQTYLTFLRLTQGTVKVEHLKGPVGIAHIGTLIADEGFIKVLFFMALISINLAVINFLPLPIVDGGQFLFLIYEWIRGKPIPIPVQNAVTMAGLLLIGSMFLLVTFNDIKSLIGF